MQSGNIAATSGQIYSAVQNSSVATPLTFDTNSGNVMLWSAGATGATALAVSVNNMKPGGSYMLVVSGSGTGAVTISCSSDGGTTPLPASYIPANGTRVNGALNKSIYTLISDGTNCMITWITGF